MKYLNAIIFVLLLTVAIQAQDSTTTLMQWENQEIVRIQQDYNAYQKQVEDLELSVIKIGQQLEVEKNKLLIAIAKRDENTRKFNVIVERRKKREDLKEEE